MHALTLARQRLRARIQHPATPRPVRLAHGLVENGQPQYLPILSSALAQELLTRGYDAFTLDHIYACRTLASTPLGIVADRLVLNLPLHLALRERHEATIGELCAAAVPAFRNGAEEYRLLMAPCGLASELHALAARLREDHPEVLNRLRCTALDPDQDGTVLSRARRRLQTVGLEARTLRADLEQPQRLHMVAAAEGPFHLISLVGASHTRTVRGCAELIRHYAPCLAPEGTLLIDYWQPAKSKAAGIGVPVASHSGHEMISMLAEHGFALQREHPTGEGGNVLLVMRKTGGH